MRKSNGFTLIELMIVISIIGILSATAMPYFSRVRERAREAKCFEFSSLLSRVAELYNIENKHYPLTNDVGELAPGLARGRLPTCPSKGVYNWFGGTPESNPGLGPRVECSIHGMASSTFGG